MKYITILFNTVINGGRVNYIVFLIIFFIISVNNSYSQTTLTYTTSGTFVPPAGVTSVSVVCRGGGGAGGGSTINKYAGNGGGGGGCSVNTSLAVAAGTSYTITVGTGGTGSTGNGGNGGSSSFGSLLTAGGGTGGNANSASGGGGGGTGTYSGGNGFDSDNNKNGPGGGGGGGGGTIANGGTATSRLGGAGGTSGGGVGGDGGWGGNIGNIGSIPGGGGGGGGDLSGSGSTNGGDGARGEITITYTCSSYSLYSLWVNGSICQGSTATVNMSAVIPVGTYTVTYNLSGANSATGNTSQMIVTSSGSGSFVTSSLANSGSTTVTITRLSSGSGNGVDPLCYSDISSNNTVGVTVNSTPYITLGTFPQVCQTVTNAYLPYTATNAEYYSIDFDATANSAGFTDFSGWGLPASPISINVPYSAPAATYNGTLTVGTYTPSCTGNSYPITVTVSGSPPVAPTSAASDRDNFCSDDAGNISLSVTGGSGTTLRWFTGSCGGTEVGTGNPLVIASPASTITYYARWENGCGNSTCASVTVTVASLATASVSISASSNPVCSGTSVTFTATPTNGGATPSYQWKKNGSNVGSNNYQYTDASLVNNDQITCEMTSSLSCASPKPATSNTITMNVNDLPTAPTSASSDRDNFCSDDAGNISLSVTGGSGTTLRWFTGSCGGTEVGTGNPLVIASPTATTTYYARWENGCGNSVCASVTVTVIPSVTASVSISASSNPVCSGTSVTFTAIPTNGGATPSYQWKKNGSNTGSNNYQYTDASLVSTDQITCEMTSSLSCATPIPATSNTITMTVNPLPQGSISGNTICSGGTGQFTYSSSSGTGPFTLIIDGTSYSGVVSGTPFNANPNPSSTTNYTLTSITDNNSCVRTSGITDATATITVNPLPSAPIAVNGERCGSGTVLIHATPVGGETNITIDWYAASSGGTALRSNDEYYTTPSITETTIYYAEARNTVTGCISASRTPVSAVIWDFPSITLTNITHPSPDSITGSGGADLCPELEPPYFIPENGSYNDGSTYVDFRIDKVFTNGDYLFGYVIECVNSTVLETILTGNGTVDPSFSGIDEVSCPEDNTKVYLRFRIDNVPNQTVTVTLTLIYVEDEECQPGINISSTQIIDPMPSVGPFN